MIPSVNIAAPYVPPPTPVTGTAVAGNSILHVPPDNVAPSVSSVQIHNNARGNSTATPSNEAPEEIVETVENEEVPQRVTTRSGGQLASAQTTFLAQLAGQEDSPQANVILVQYEKLVAFSNVKYKPSNALKPEAEPAGIFGRIMQEEKTSAPVQQEAPPPPPPADVEEHARIVVHAEPQLAAPPPVRAKPAPVSAAVTENEGEEPAAPVPAGITAYQASVFRVLTQGASHIEDLA